MISIRLVSILVSICFATQPKPQPKSPIQPKATQSGGCEKSNRAKEKVREASHDNLSNGHESLWQSRKSHPENRGVFLFNTRNTQHATRNTFHIYSSSVSSSGPKPRICNHFPIHFAFTLLYPTKNCCQRGEFSKFLSLNLNTISSSVVSTVP